MTRNFQVLACSVALSLVCAACDRGSSKPSEPEQLVPPIGVPKAPGSPQPAAPEPIPAKVDTMDPASLKAGLTTMNPRIVSQVDAFKKIAPNERSRLFMHPDDAKNASVEFDTKGLSSLDLSPYMEDFSSNPDCMKIPEAGVVQFSWFIDGSKKGSLTVDRHYKGIVNLNVANSSRLKLEVDKGNGVLWCDWFSVGFLNVK
jgi:hypothetical protein